MSDMRGMIWKGKHKKEKKNLSIKKFSPFRKICKNNPSLKDVTEKFSTKYPIFLFYLRFNLTSPRVHLTKVNDDNPVPRIYKSCCISQTKLSSFCSKRLKKYLPSQDRLLCEVSVDACLVMQTVVKFTTKRSLCFRYDYSQSIQERNRLENSTISHK